MQIVAELVVVVLARAEPPEPFGAGAHLRGELRVGEMRVALEIHPGDGDAVALGDVEDHADGRRIPLVHVQRLRLREVVAPRVIQRIDAGAAAHYAGRIERPTFRERDLVAHAVLGQALDAADRPPREDGPLVHVNHEHVFAARLLLRHPDVVELATRIERLDGALDIAIVDRVAGLEAADLNDAGGVIASLPDHRN